MNSLKEVYGNMVQRDHEKVAQARAAQGLPPTLDQFPSELVKQAQAYDQIGRVMARQAYVDMLKQAMDEAGVPADKQEDELAKLLAGGGEKKDEEKKEGESEGEKKDEEKEGEGEGGEAKEAAARFHAKRKKIMAKMAKDPQYVSTLIAKHMPR